MTATDPHEPESPPAASHLPWPEKCRLAIERAVLHSRWLLILTCVLGLIAMVAGQGQRSEATLSFQMARGVFLFLPALALLVIRSAGSWAQVLWTSLIFFPLAAAWTLHDLGSAQVTSSQFGEVPVPEAFTIRRYLVAAAIASPVLMMAALRRATLLDRYLLREWIFPFLFCLVAFFSIWLVFDLNDNLGDFREHNPSWADILNFYVVQIPHIFTKIAEAAVLIATVYALSRFSRSNEFTAILSSGRSLGRTLLPLFLCGSYISFLYLVFNYQWAPLGEGKKEFLLDQFSGDQKTAIATKHLYINEKDRRTWYIGEIPYALDSEELRVVDIQEQAADNHRTRSIQAASASWDLESGRWTFYRAYITEFPREETQAPRSVYREWHHEHDWRESRWQVVNQRMEPDYLGVPGLISYVKTTERDGLPRPHAYLTNLQHRWAAPWGCFTILFIAAPLGISFSRRGILGGVASAIFLFGAILFLTELFLALGKSGHLAPLGAAWLANLVFLLLGGLFLYLRAGNRSFNLFWWRQRASS